MKTYIAEPLRGIRGSVRFGMTREEARAVLAPASPKPFDRGGLVDGFYGMTLQVGYDAEGKVEFIEFARDGRVLLDDLDLFELEADRVVARLKEKHELSADDTEPGYSFCFPSIELGLWRPVLPLDGEEGRYFESVGFGRSGYYSKNRG